MGSVRVLPAGLTLHCCLLATAPGAAAPDDEVASPVHGCYRPGKLTPLQVRRDPGSEVRIEGEGLIPVRLAPGARDVAVVVPLLPLESPRGPVTIRRGESARTVSLEWRPLSGGERLVGTAGGLDADELKALFSERQVVVEPLDIDRLLSGPLIAWEVLDAIAGDAAAMSRLDDAALRLLLACGVTVAVRTAAAPDGRWPWTRRGAWWVLDREPLGPGTSLTAAAYGPVRRWSPRPPARARALLAGLVALAALGILISWRGRRSRSAMLAGALVAAGSAAGLVAATSRFPEHHEAQGTVAVCGGGLLQHDFWSYLAPGGDGAAVSCAFFQLADQPPQRFAHIATRPVLAAPEQAWRQGVTLELDAAGKPARWTARLPRDEHLAFLTRMVDPEPAAVRPPAATTDSPMQTLAREAYEAPGARVIGEGHPRTDVRYGFVEVFVEREP